MFELVVNTYNSLKYVHVLSAVVWVGGACTVQAFAIRISATGDGARMATFAKDAEYVGNRIFLPSSIILLVSGIFTIHESGGGWSYDQTWVQVGLAMINADFAQYWSELCSIPISFIIDMVKRAQAGGHCVDDDPHLLAQAIVAMLNQFCYLQLAEDSAEPDDHACIATLSNIFYRAIFSKEPA